MTSITDGLGNTCTFNYAPLTSGAPLYTKGSSATYPVQDVQSPMQVVSSYKEFDGNSSDAYTLSYTYSGAQYDALGHGFLGFTTRTITDGRSGNKETLTYSHQYPWTGRVIQDQMQKSDGTTNIQVTTNTGADDLQTLGSGPTQRHFPFFDSSVTTDYDTVNGTVQAVRTSTTALHRADFDAYGNFTNNSSSPDGTTVTDLTQTGNPQFSSNAVTAYASASSTYCVAAPSSKAITHTVPAASLTGVTYATTASRNIGITEDTTHCRETAYTMSGGTASLTTSYPSFDAFGNATEVDVTGTDVSRRTNYSYAGGNGEFPTSITYMASATQNLTTSSAWYYDLGQKSTDTDANGNVTIYFYDGFGRLTGVKRPDGTSITYAYSWCSTGMTGCPTYASYLVTTSQLSNDAQPKTIVTAYASYDQRGRVIEQGRVLIGGVWSLVDTTYDNMGHVTMVTKPYLSGSTPGFNTSYSYDMAMNRVSLVKAPQDENDSTSSESTYSYTYSGFTTSIRHQVQNSAAASTTQTTLTTGDATGEVIYTLDANGGSTTYNYDAWGDLAGVQDADGNISTMSYDGLGHKTGMTDADMGTWTYQVNALGQITCQTDADTQSIIMGYDDLGRLTSKLETAPGGSCTATSGTTSAWTYDTQTKGLGLPATVKDTTPSGTGFIRTYSYDSVSRPNDVTSTIAGTAYDVSTSFDSFGRVQTVTYPVSATPAANGTAPTAVATATPTTITLGASATLDGSKSTDPNGLALQYQWSQSAGPTMFNIGAFDSASATTQLTPTVAGTYSFQLQVIDSNSAISAPVTVSVAVDPAVPGAPNLSAYNYTGGYQLQWSQIAGADSYVPYESVNGGSYSALPTVMGANNTSLPLSAKPNGTYSYEIAACGNGACSNPGPAAGTTVLLAPAGLSASPAGTSPNGSFTLSWTRASTATYYLVFQSVNGGSYAQLTQVSQPAAPANPSYPINAGSASYSYEVEACNAGGCSPASGSVGENVPPTPGAPGAPYFSANPSTNGVYSIAWGSVSVSGEPAVTYHLEEATGNSSGPTSSFTEIWSGTNNGASANHSNNASFYYWYRVRAQDEMGYGPYSSVSSVHVVVAPSAPSLNPSYKTVKPGVTYTLSWGGSGPAVSYYQLYASLDDPNFTNPSMPYQGSGTSASYSKSSAYNTHDFYYEVRACNVSDGFTACGAFSASADIYIYASGGAVLWKDTGERLASTGRRHPSLSATLGDSQSASASSLTLSSGPQQGSNSIAANPVVIKVSADNKRESNVIVAATELERLAGLEPVSSPPSTESARVADLFQKVQQERRLIATQPLQPSETALQAAVDSRSAAHMTATLSPVVVGMQAFRNPALGIPGQPTYAPPAYAAYADSRIRNVTSTPYRFAVVNSYDPSSGALEAVSSADTGFIYWRAATSTGMAPVDAFGHLLAYTDGNNVSTVNDYDSATGDVNVISTGVGTSTSVQQLVYNWDGFRNLKQRCDVNKGLMENFGYDGINRLGSSTVYSGATYASGQCSSSTAGPAIGVTYYPGGNIQTLTNSGKSGIGGTYTYDPNHHHAVSTVSNIPGTNSYDANGNLLCRFGTWNGTACSGGTAVTWNSDNLPVVISAASGNSSTFTYSPDLQRITQSTVDAVAGNSSTTYVGSLFEVVSTAGSSEYRHNIMAGGTVVAVHTLNQSGAATTTYLHSDHLGSLDVITSDAGNVTQQMSFDAFGLRRDPTNWTYDLTSTQIAGLKSNTDRGYTFQEQLDNVSLVHMNGRIYDPATGRMVSADMTVPNPLDSQSLNRYSYVYNNSLKYVDPSGYGPTPNNLFTTNSLFSSQAVAEGTSLMQALSPSHQPDPSGQNQTNAAAGVALIATALVTVGTEGLATPITGPLMVGEEATLTGSAAADAAVTAAGASIAVTQGGYDLASAYSGSTPPDVIDETFGNAAPSVKALLLVFDAASVIKKPNASNVANTAASNIAALIPTSAPSETNNSGAASTLPGASGNVPVTVGSSTPAAGNTGDQTLCEEAGCNVTVDTPQPEQPTPSPPQSKSTDDCGAKGDKTCPP